MAIYSSTEMPSAGEISLIVASSDNNNAYPKALFEFTSYFVIIDPKKSSFNSFRMSQRLVGFPSNRSFSWPLSCTIRTSSRNSSIVPATALSQASERRFPAAESWGQFSRRASQLGLIVQDSFDLHHTLMTGLVTSTIIGNDQVLSRECGVDDGAKLPKILSTVSFAGARIYEVTIPRLGCPQTDAFGVLLPSKANLATTHQTTAAPEQAHTAEERPGRWEGSCLCLAAWPRLTLPRAPLGSDQTATLLSSVGRSAFNMARNSKTSFLRLQASGSQNDNLILEHSR
jgi:hypothetical protein